MICIKSNRTVVHDHLLEEYQQEFKKKHVFVISALLDTSLRNLIGKHLSDASWYIKVHERKSSDNLLAKEFALNLDNPLYKILHFYMNHPHVIDAVKEITGISDIMSFNGRIYRFDHSENCYDNWHTDINAVTNDRLVGLSLNLSDSVYEGGIFRLRNRESKTVYKEVKHDLWGGAHFFRISPDLEHMVTGVKGTKPRIAYAGWFSKTNIKSKI